MNQKPLIDALRPFAKFAERFNAKPLSGIDDEVYAIHGGDGCEYGASLRLSDCRRALEIVWYADVVDDPPVAHTAQLSAAEENEG